MSDHKEPAVQQPEPAPSAADVEAFNKHLKGYIKIGIIEFIFTVVTVGISFWAKPMGTKIILTLLSATGNAILVAAILMHLKDEKKMVWKVLFFTGAFLIVLFFLTWLARSDEIIGALHNHH